MNLDGKYIEINVNNVNDIITFLCNKGYTYEYNSLNYQQIVDDFVNRTKFNGGVIYIDFLDTIYHSRWDIPNCECIDIKYLYREYKLKRILK